MHRCRLLLRRGTEDGLNGKDRRADLTWYAGIDCTSPSQVRTGGSLPAAALLLGKFLCTASIMDGVTSTTSMS